MEAALKGDWREEHLFVLKQALESDRALWRQIAECDAATEKALARVTPDASTPTESERPRNPIARRDDGKKRRRKQPRGNALQVDLPFPGRPINGRMGLPYPHPIVDFALWTLDSDCPSQAPIRTESGLDLARIETVIDGSGTSSSSKSPGRQRQWAVTFAA
jgi:hypothetical protein